MCLMVKKVIQYCILLVVTALNEVEYGMCLLKKVIFEYSIIWRYDIIMRVKIE